MIAEFDDVLAFVQSKYEEAKEGSEEIVFPIEKYAMSEGAIENRSGDIVAKAPSITDEPRFKVLKHSKGLSAWAVILAVDLRGSTRRALALGAEKTYLTMHTYLPTMAHLIEKADGKVVGLRGDGLFGAFGVTELDGSGREVTSEVAGRAVKNAVLCGKAMIEAIEDAINPTLEEDGVEGDLAVGVGVDTGDVVITRIGWESASEVTAYGAPVNHACKSLSSRRRNVICVSKAVTNTYPSGKAGKVSFLVEPNAGFRASFPRDFHMLRRTQKRKPR